jgi:hypothetical protein
MSYVNENVTEEILDENAVTAKANAGDKAMPKLEGGASAENLGGPDVKTYKPDDKESIGKKAAARVKHEGSKSLSTKPSDASSKLPEEAEVEGEDLTEEETGLDLEDDLNALVSGEELSEEFKEKARTIFEAVITSKVNAEIELINEAAAEILEEEIEKTKAELAEKVDGYLSYVAGQWLEENDLAIENGIKEEISKSFIGAIKNVFEEYNVEIPEEESVLSELTDQINSMESRLNEQIETNVELNKRLGGYIKNGIVNEVAAGLAETQKEKLASLAEGVVFEDEESFRQKVQTIRESYFHKQPVEAKIEENIQPGDLQEHAPAMAAYLNAISRWSK